MRIKQTNIWKFISSVKLAIWLLAAIAAISMLGTLIPQNEEPALYISKYGSAGYDILLKTGLIRVYSVWWFILLLVLFTINLTACLLNRFSLKRRSLGSVLSHLSVLVILFGALIGLLWGEKGYIRISRGESLRIFVMPNKQVDLGFNIRLDDFIYTENIDPREKLLVYSAAKGAFCKMHGPAESDVGTGLITQISVNNKDVESDIADTGYKIKIQRYVSDFTMDTSTKEVVSRSAKPNNPAIQVQLKDKEGAIKTFWVFARFPDMQQEGMDFKFIYNWHMRTPKDFVSKVTILKEDKEIMSKDIRVNDPLRFAGYTFYQSSYDNEQLNWSGLQVVKDPGVVVIYFGFILLITGLVMIFYVNPVLSKKQENI